MANDNINLSLKITADLNEAKAGISALNAAIKDTADTTQSSNAKSAQSWKNVYEAQTEAMNRAHRSIDAEQKQSEAQDKAAKAAETHKKHIEKLRSELDSLLGSIDPAVKALGKLDAQEQKLRDAKKAGLVDNETYDNFLGKINEQRESVSNVDKLTQGTGKLSLNTRTARRDMAGMIRQIASGNFTSAGNSMFNLANTTGKFPPIFSAATISIAAFAAASFGLYKVISDIQADQERWNRAIVTTGNYAGTTAASLDTMSKRIGAVNHNYGETRTVVAELASEGNLSAESIENIATASAYMSALTGKSAQEAVKSFSGIKDSVTNWALESNKQYHWLDIATYQRIAALEAQGNTEEAIAIATGKYADSMEERAKEMKAQLNWLESAWDSFKNGVADLGESIKTELKLSLGLSNLDEEIKKLQDAKKIGMYSGFGYAMEWNDSFEKDLQNKLAEREKLEKQAQLQREQVLVQEKAIQAEKTLQDIWQQNATEAEKQAKSIENIRKQYEALWATVDGRKSLEAKGVMSEDGKTFTGGQYDTDVKGITDTGLKQYNQELEKSLELQKEKTTLAKVEFEISSGQYKNASKVEKDKAIALAKQVDALKEREKLEKQSAANSKQNLDLQNQLNQLLLGSKNNDATVQAWYDNLHKQLTKAGNKQGLDLIDQLLPLKKAQANIDELSAKIQQAKNNQAIKEQSIQAQVTSGTITQIEAQSQLVDLHKATAKELSSYIPLLKQVAAMPGEVGRAGQMALSQLELEVAQLERTSDALTNALRNGLQNGIQSSLEGLALGTSNLSEAINNLGLSVAKAMANIASQGLAEMAMNGLDSLFGGDEAESEQSAGEQIKASMDEGTTNLTTSLGLTFDEAAIKIANAIIAASSGNPQVGAPSSDAGLPVPMSTGTDATNTAASSMSDAMTSAGASAAASMGSAITSAALTGSGDFSSALNSVFASAISSLISAMASNAMSSAAGSAAGAAFASGGYVRGAGTATSDSIPARLSNGEYVIRAAAVQNIGVGYLNAINEKRIKPFASGGLVSNVRTPGIPKMDNQTSAQGGATLSPVIQQTLVVDGGEVFTAGINSTQGKRQMMTFIKANNSTIRQTLGLD